MTDTGFEGLFEKLERVRLDFASLVREVSEFPEDAEADGHSGAWSEPLDAWWRRERDGADPELVALYENLVEHGRVLFMVAERLGGGEGEESTRSGKELMAVLAAFQQSMGECLRVPAGANDMFSPLSHLVVAWQRQAASVFGLPPNPAQALPNVLSAKDRDELRRALAAMIDPGGIAASRLHGENLESLARSLADYQDAFNRLARLAVEAAGEAISCMDVEAGAGAADEAQGVRELYDRWLGCCEGVYDDLSRDAEFARILGDLVNGAVRVQAQRQRLVDSAARSLGLPTRGDLRALSASLHESRRRLSRIERGAAMPNDGNPLARSARRATRRAEAPTTTSRATPNVAAASDPTPRHKTAEKKLARRQPSARKSSSDVVEERAVASRSTKKKALSRKATRTKRAVRKRAGKPGDEPSERSDS